MPSKAWATPDQEALLNSRLEDYRQHRLNRLYTPFWESFFEEWENKYPERRVVFPELSPDDELSEAQEESLGKAIEKRQGQIMTWFRWHVQIKGRSAQNKKTKTLNSVIFGSSRSRLPQLTELYSDMYYDEKIAPLVKKQSPANRSESLSVIKQVTRTLWDQETSDVIDRVKARYDELREEKKQKESNPPTLPSAEEVSGHLHDLPALMGRFLEYLETVTGWSFTCLMGGPDPEQGGNIRVGSYHVGKTPSGKTFNQTWSNFNEAVMGPFSEHLHVVYPESTRLDRSSAATKVETPEHVVEDNKKGKKQTKGKKGEKSKGTKKAQRSACGPDTSATSITDPACTPSLLSSSSTTLSVVTETPMLPPSSLSANDLVSSIVARSAFTSSLGE
ncbi:hypothetical protein H0H93_010406, partial [Arthromyces matolae]